MRRLVAAIAAVAFAFGGTAYASTDADAAVVCNQVNWNPHGRQIDLEGPTTMYLLNPAYRCGLEATKMKFSVVGYGSYSRLAHETTGGLWYAILPDSAPKYIHVSSNTGGDGGVSGWVKFKEDK